MTAYLTSVPRARVDIPGVKRDEVVIKRSRLYELEQKEASHDDYLAAIKGVEHKRIVARNGILYSAKPEWYKGYAEALTDLSQGIVDAARGRMDVS